MKSDLISGLNPQQREAVTAVDGPVLVLAGPGSGKTRVLTHRIAHLIQNIGIRPPHILAVTFTNKAAAEMRARVESLLGGRTDGLQIGTFHAICARLLRMEADHTPYRRDYVIYDTDDQQALMKRILADLDFDSKKFNPGRVLAAISQAKNELIGPGEFTGGDYFGEVVSRIYPIYQQRLVASNAMDFDDLLMQTAILLSANDEVRARYQQRYQYILIDEFQDTNQAQYQLVRMLGRPQDNVFVVGDEDQGIYAFRGADYRNVMAFRRDYPNARVILLEQNYRSTQVVLDAARAVIDRNTFRTPKALFTDRQGGAPITIHEAYSEREEGEYIAEQIARLRRQYGYSFSAFAVMYRTNAQSRALEDAMRLASIPYRLVGGVGFYKRREIRDLIAYLRLINNPEDQVSLARVINTPGRGIGDKSAEAFIRWAGERGGVLRALQALASGETGPVTGRAGRGLADFAALIVDLRQMAEAGDLVALFDELTARLRFTAYLSEISETDEQVVERMENVSALRGFIGEKHDLALADFLADIALVADVDQAEDGADSVTLLTLHAAKGLEFPVVFLAGLEDGLLPHSRSFNEPDAMAEERRLLYVGITRAKDVLYLTYAFRRSIYGDSTVSVPSRFLTDIPAELTGGVSPHMKQLRDRASYERQTRWDSPGDALTGGRSGVRGAGLLQRPSGTDELRAELRSKIIPFNGGRGNEKPAEPPLRYRRGMRVYHNVFGEGTVIDSRLSAGDEEVSVKFQKVGTKLLSAAFANLTILE
ncbi:MAG: ATP-dependent helicase [Candidatus Flexifilum sp.]